MSLRFLFCAIFAFVLSTSSFAATLTVTEGSVTWHALDSLGVTKIDGEGGKPTGTITKDGGKVSGTFECAMADFKTGIALRDAHMKEKYLVVDKYPKATLKLDPVADSGDVDWTGTLTLKDVTKPVKGKAHITANSVEATFSINTDDFNVGSPKFMGVQMGTTVDITVRAEAK